MEAVALHAFERAGLGRAPFKYVGSYESKFQAIPGDPNCPIQAGSSCDYCAQSIVLVCVIRDADGKEFKVGCDCVRRTGDVKLAKAVDAKVAARRRQMKDARELEILAKAELVYTRELAKLEALPHPNPRCGGLTLADCWTWAAKHAGRAGKVRAAKAVIAAIAG